MTEPSEQLAAGLAAGYVLIELVTWEEERALELVRRAAKRLQRPVNVWSVSSGFGEHKGAGPADPAGALSRIAATADPRVFVLHDFHIALSDPLVVRRLRELCTAMQAKGQGIVITCPASCVPVELDKEMLIMDLAPPDGPELAGILDECIRKSGHEGALKNDAALRDAVIRAALGLTARETRRMMMRILGSRLDFSKDQVKEVLDEKKQVLRRTELLEFYEVSETMNDVGGLDLLKKWLMDRAGAFSDRAREYGLPEPKGLLLLGVQGCGKSLSSKAVSRLWSIPLLRLDLSAILDREAEGDQLRRSLRMAEGLSPCVLWIDEIEKGFSSRRVSGAGEQGRTARAFAGFLTWLQDKKRPVYVIATANSISEMPPELVRKGRFDDIFFVDLPNDVERREIFRIHLEKRGRKVENFDIAEMAGVCEGFSGSEIEQAVISAMFDAFTAEREVETKDIVRALRETVPLSQTLEEQIKDLRDWAKTRARPASLDTKLMDLLQREQGPP